MRRVLAVTAVLLIAACAPPGDAGSGKIAPDVGAALESAESVRVVILLRDVPAAPETGALADDARSALAAASAGAVRADQDRVLANLEPGEFRLTRRYQHVRSLVGEVTRAGLARLAADPDVAAVGVPGWRRASMAESRPLVRADEAHVLGLTGRGVLVAVLDTGIDASHPDLRDALVDEACFCTGCACPGGPDRATDDDGHGTHVSGIIASAGRVAPAGVAPGAGIVALKVLGPEGGDDEGILAALDALVGKGVRVINMSLGGGRFSTVCDGSDAINGSYGQLLATLRSQGTLTVVAAGNESFADAVASPACINAAVAVGAVYDGDVGGLSFGDCDDRFTRGDLPTCFSNSSPLVELFAPGALITSAGLGGGLLTEGGTSQATPHVAGAAAVLFQANPGLTPSQVVQALAATGPRVTDPKNGLTFPRIDVRAALDVVR